ADPGRLRPLAGVGAEGLDAAAGRGVVVRRDQAGAGVVRHPARDRVQAGEEGPRAGLEGGRSRGQLPGRHPRRGGGAGVPARGTAPMSWPLPTEFNEAVQTPSLAFADPDLRAGQATVGPLGLPLPRSGNFADVYQIRGANGRDWAVKCFTRPVPGLDDRYRKVGEALAKAGLPFTVGFTYLAEGIKVRGRWLPALKMEWVEGLLLNQFVRENAGNPAALEGLLRSWVKLCQKLR